MSKKTRKAEKKSGSGKKLPKSKKLLHDLEPRNLGIETSLDMKINLWYNKGVKQWRWTLLDDRDERRMESGNSGELEVALSDIRQTIEWMLGEEEESSPLTSTTN